MAVAGSGVIPRKATLEARVLPANTCTRRQPPGRTRDSTPLSENHTPDPVTGLPRRALSRGDAPGTALVRAAASSSDALPAALRPIAPQIRRFASRPPPALAIPTGQCRRPGGRLRATASVALL